MINATPNLFNAAFEKFYAGCVDIYNRYCDAHNFTVRNSFSFTEGSRYMKVIYGAGDPPQPSVHCFVDKTNGDVLKAASWKIPARHARGNIFDEKNGLGLMGPHGPAYLR